VGHLGCFHNLAIAHPGLKQHYSQYSNYIINRIAHQPMQVQSKYQAFFIYNGVLFCIKKNEIILFSGKWMKLENFMLSKISQDEKVKGHMFSPICQS
jgi:hypothetical protein